MSWKSTIHATVVDIGCTKEQCRSLRFACFLVIGALAFLLPAASAQQKPINPTPTLDGGPVLEESESFESATGENPLDKPLVVQPGIFEAAVPMGAASGIAPTFEDINPDQSTLDATDPDGASGGRVNGLASVAGDNQTFYLASEWGGIYQSIDGGLQWSFLAGHMPLATWDVEVDPTTTTIVYATSFYDGKVQSISGIQVSTDAGVTWTHPASAVPNAPANEGTPGDNTPQAAYSCTAARRTEPSAFGIGIRPDASNNVFIGTNCGVAISTDSGATWQFVDANTTPGAAGDVWDVVVQAGGPTNQGIVDVCGASGHFRSTNGGMTWTGGSAQLPGGRCSIAVSPDETYVLFVAAADNFIYESDDAGANWAPLGSPDIRVQGRIPFVATNQRLPGPGPTDLFDLWFSDVSLFRGGCTSQAAQGGALRCPTAYGPAVGLPAIPNPYALPAGWAGPFTRCRDADGNGCAHDDGGDIVFDTQAANDACPMLYSNDGGVYYNTDTGGDCQDPDWEQPDVTPHALWLFGMDGVDVPGDNTEHLYFGLQDDGTFASTDAGSATPTWFNRDCCDSFDIVADATRVVSTLCCGFSIRYAGPGMVGNTTIATNPPGNIPSFRYRDFIQQYGDNQYIAVTSAGAFITTDITASPLVNWTQLGTQTGFCGVHVSKAANGTPVFYAETFCVGGNNGIVETLGSGQLWKYTGTNPAGTWVRVDNNDGLTGGNFAIVGVDPNNANRIYASYRNPIAGPQMVFSKDGGTTWGVDNDLDALMQGGGAIRYQTQRGVTPGPRFTGYIQPSLVAFDPEDPNIIVAGGRDSGVFISRNGGGRWALLTDPFDSANSGIPHLPRPWFAYFDHEPEDSKEVRIYVGTQGRGVWRITVPIDVPVISVPGPVNFGQVCEGSTFIQTLNVCNTGGTNLVIEEIASSNANFAVTTPTSGYPLEISPDFCFPFQVTFTPTGQGLQNATLSIFSNDPVDPVLDVDVFATVGAAAISTFIANNGSFGDVCADDHKDLNLTIQNNGLCKLMIDSVALSGPDAGDFQLPSGSVAGSTIEPGNSLLVPVRFAPTNFTDPSPRTASVDVASRTLNGAPLPLDQTPIDGIVPPPDIQVAIANSGNFGNVCKGEHADLDLTLFNQGKCDLTISAISILQAGSSFDLPDDVTVPLILSPDADFPFPIRYAPTVCNDDGENATVVIISDDPDEETVEVDISGGSPCPNLVIDPVSLANLYAFPATVVDTGGGALGCFSERSAVLRNTGECPLTIADISAAGADFAVTAPTRFPIILPTGEETLGVTVRFTPQADANPLAPNQVTGLLTVVSDDPDFPHTADLCGESVAQSGVRILVTDVSSGTPVIVDEVDSITIQSQGLNRPGPINLRFTNQPVSSAMVCGNTIAYHVDQETLPSTATTGSNPQSSYEGRAKEGNLQTAQSFGLGQCEFREFQLQLQDSRAAACLLLPQGAACTTGGECCSGSCQGPTGGKTCR